MYTRWQRCISEICKYIIIWFVESRGCVAKSLHPFFVSQNKHSFTTYFSNKFLILLKKDF